MKLLIHNIEKWETSRNSKNSPISSCYPSSWFRSFKEVLWTSVGLLRRQVFW